MSSNCEFCGEYHHWSYHLRNLPNKPSLPTRVAAWWWRQTRHELPMKTYTVTCTLTVAFGLEDSIEGKPSEEEAQEHFLEWIGTSSDGFILEGLNIKIEEDVVL